MRAISLTRRLAVGLVVLLSSATALVAAPRIGVLLKDRSPGFWVFAEHGAQQAAESLGVEVTIKAPPSVLDVAAQGRLLAALSAERLDALVIAPTNPDVIEGAVKQLAAKGVKIVCVDTPLTDGVAHAFVGADQAAMADAAAQLFLSLARDGDQVALLRNNSVDRTVMTREDTLRAAMKTRPGLVFHSDIFASSEKDSEDERALVLLKKYPNVKAVFASATRGTLATIKAVRELGLVGKVKVVGFGTYLPPEAAQAFEDGILYGWIAQQPKDLGTKGLRAAAALVAGEPVPSVIRPDFMLVTHETFRSNEVKVLLNPESLIVHR